MTTYIDNISSKETSHYHNFIIPFLFRRRTKQLSKYFHSFLPQYYQKDRGSHITDSCNSKNHETGAFSETAHLKHLELWYFLSSGTCVLWAITKLWLFFPPCYISDFKTTKALGSSKVQTFTKQNRVGSTLSKDTDFNLHRVTRQNTRERCSNYSNQDTF